MGKVIDFNEFRKKKNTGTEYTTIPGFLVWLHCPNCQTTEYTEVRMEGGRIHKCGTFVEEVEIQIDIRAEYTISKRNLDIITQEREKSLSGLKEILKKKLLDVTSKLLTRVKNNELEYQRRLELMHARSIVCYPNDWDPEKNGIEFTTVEPTGIMITAARQVDKHFPQKK